MPFSRALSFRGITKGVENSVRITDDDFVYATDLIAVITGKSRDTAGLRIQRLPETVFASSKFEERKNLSISSDACKVVSLLNAIELTIVLPGKFDCRKEIAQVIFRYMNGDASMMCYIETHVSWKYVYASASPAFPGLIKIGKATNVDRRMAQLNVGCAPSPHVVVAIAKSLDYTRDEKRAHDFFSSRRHEGEFFQVSHEEVRDYFNKTITACFQTELAKGK